MILRFKKVAVILVVLVMVVSFVTGCSKDIKSPAGNTTSTSENNKSEASDKQSEGSNTEIQGETSENSNTEAQEKQSEDNSIESSAKSSEGNTTENSGVKNNSSSTTKNNSQEELLKDMMKLAQQGKIINSEFAAKTTVIEEVEKKLGKVDKVEWIPEAKGNYVAYPKYNLAFGFNKGMQVFEVRSFDSKLKSITLSMVKKAYGKPAYDVKVNGEEIIGYTAGQEFKILLVFKEPSSSNKNPSLDHYSVLYPSGTVNMMADDPGREW